jgi:cardiolipin synthase
MSVLTPANQLTLTRVMLAPAFVILTVYGYFGWALVAFAIAGLTDLLDGLIARALGSRTSLGAWLDPMADKLLIVATVSVLTVPGLGLVNKLPVWLTILIISRDLLIVLTVAVINFAIGRREFRPSIFGKIATATYIVTCVTMMYFNYLRRPSMFVTAGIYASAAITLISGFHYMFNVTRIINQSQKPEAGTGGAGL